MSDDLVGNDLNPDMHVDEGDPRPLDTSVGGEDESHVAEQEQEAIENKEPEPEHKEEVKGEEPEIDPVIRESVIYHIKTADNFLIGDGYHAGTPAVARVISENEDGTLNLETVSPLGLDGNILKVVNVTEGENAGQYKVK